MSRWDMYQPPRPESKDELLERREDLWRVEIDLRNKLDEIVSELEEINDELRKRG